MSIVKTQSTRDQAHSRIVGRFLVLIAGLALAPALTGAPMTSTIKLAETADTGSFARYVPFGDTREVIVRRGKELGFRYGFEQGRRMVQVRGGRFALVTYQNLLSPPPLLPGQEPMSTEAAKQYAPLFDVLYLPDAEVLIAREPNGFTDAEVEQILDAVSVH